MLRFSKNYNAMRAFHDAHMHDDLKSKCVGEDTKMYVYVYVYVCTKICHTKSLVYKAPQIYTQYLISQVHIVCACMCGDIYV
jgi:hypothetical protein